MGWIGRRYIIGIGFRGYASEAERLLISGWLAKLVEKYEMPEGIPLTLVSPKSIPPVFMKDWVTVMSKWDEQILGNFIRLFTFVVEKKRYWQDPNPTSLAMMMTLYWKEMLKHTWSKIKDDPRWNNSHLRVLEEKEIRKLEMPKHYVDQVYEQNELLLAMADSEVVKSWVEEKLEKSEQQCEDSSYCS
jgi:hypothetical protein